MSGRILIESLRIIGVMRKRIALEDYVQKGGGVY